MTNETIDVLEARGFSIVDTNSADYRPTDIEPVSPNRERKQAVKASSINTDQLNIDIATGILTAGSLALIGLSSLGISVANTQEMREWFIRAQGVGLGNSLAPIALFLSSRALQK